MNKSYDVYMCREDCPENALDRDKIISMTLFPALSLHLSCFKMSSPVAQNPGFFNSDLGRGLNSRGRV